jgi:ATP-dependent DNA helicase UvrD/PcrA
VPLGSPELSSLGRGVVVNADTRVPERWAESPVVVIDAAALDTPQDVVTTLFAAWSARRPVVVELHVDPAKFRAPESIRGDVWSHTPATEPWFDRLHFLVWANNYDARNGEPVWWWSTKASRLLAGSTVATPVTGAADVRLANGTTAWIDGGPRRPWDAASFDGLVIHSESVDAGVAAPAPPATEPKADLAADQLESVNHTSGAARIIAPAGSGKTRVLTERLRHLVVDRGYETQGVLAVAYNKQAQLEMEARTADFGPHVRTLNSLGLWVLNRHRGSSPAVIDEREARNLVDSLLPGNRRRRANTDPIGPYLEGLAAIRLGLRDPDEVEGSRDDVDGLAEIFPRYREKLLRRGVVDFDEQIYSAIETLLGHGEFRRAMQRWCRHLLVDEFQDLTPGHVLMIRLLSLPALDVFGVGDDDQCIYGHAGADPGFLIDYGELFPGAAAHALRVNYRCPVDVVSGAATLLGYNLRRVTKEIVPGPENDATPDALRVVRHGPDEAATATVDAVTSWLAEPGVTTESIAVLSRVNSLLLAPHVALHEAGIPLRSELTPDVLGRTGLRAALAYLRIATSPAGFDQRDVVEILRRPSRGLPQWFGERLARRKRWTVSDVAGLADQVPEKDFGKVLDLADDLRLVVDAGRQGTTRDILEVVRDDVGLGAAMSLLDRTGGGQGSSHLDDLEGLLGVADLHPEAATFGTWLGELFQRESDPAGVTLSTIHRVKGREWDRVAVFGVSDGIVPHRLADDEEEERRVLHVGITRGRRRVVVLSDRTRPSSFLDELSGTAAKKTPPRPGVVHVRRFNTPRLTPAAPGQPAAVVSSKSGRTTPSGSARDGIAAAPGLRVKVLGGYEGEIEALAGRGVTIRLDSGGSLAVRFGERVEVAGRRAPLTLPDVLWGDAAAAEKALRAWRTKRATADGVPAYVVINDRYLRGIAVANPSTAAELAGCDGIGPAKLEKYADEILDVLSGVRTPGA